MVDHDLVGAGDCLQAWKLLDLTTDQMFYRLKFKYSVLPALLSQTKQRKQQADQAAIHMLRRMARRMEKAKQEEDHVSNS